MSRIFCPKCKSLMNPEKNILKCSNCNFTKKANLKETEKLIHEKERGFGFVKDKDVFATFPFKCKKCGYNKAEIIDQGVKYTDEAGEILLKCGKCGQAERLEKKTS